MISFLSIISRNLYVIYATSLIELILPSSLSIKWSIVVFDSLTFAVSKSINSRYTAAYWSASDSTLDSLSINSALKMKKKKTYQKLIARLGDPYTAWIVPRDPSQIVLTQCESADSKRSYSEVQCNAQGCPLKKPIGGPWLASRACLKAGRKGNWKLLGNLNSF